MPIKVRCRCGQGFTVKESLAGKILKCPKCGTNSRIPPPKQPARAGEPQRPPAAAQEPGAPLGQPTAVAKDPGPAEAESPQQPTAMADLFDEMGLDGAAVSEPCPQCGTPMPQGTVLCVTCGFNVKQGRRGAAKRPMQGSPPKRATSERRGWTKVEVGLSISLCSLVVGVISFSIIAIAIVLISSDLEAAQELLNSSAQRMTGQFLGILMVWCVIAFAVSCVSLITGWLVCWTGSDRTTAYGPILGCVGCVGAAVVLLLLSQLIPVMLAPDLSEIESAADWEAARDRAEFLGKVIKVFVWLTLLAGVGAHAAFGLFAGAIGRHLRRGNLGQLAGVFAIFEGIFCVWITFLFFVLKDEWFNSAQKPIVIATLAMVVATQASLIYLVHQARGLVQARC